MSETVIVGAGPVGLTAANLLASHGHEVTVLEARSEPDRRVRAIGVTPPSLDIFDRISDGLGSRLASLGCPVRTADVFGDRRLVGSLSFNGIHPRYPFIVAVPQYHTEGLLREAAEASPRIRLEYGVQVTGLEVDGSPGVAGNRARITDAGGRQRSAELVCLCTGKGSLASQLGVRTAKRYRVRFLIGDYPEHEMTGGTEGSTQQASEREARLYFSREGSVEAFPLPGGVRRWIVQLPEALRSSMLDGNLADSLLREAVSRRAGITLPAGTPLWWSNFKPERSEAERFAHGPVMLAGDAAHTMSPIGGQGMNTGIADAELLADLVQLWRNGEIRPTERNNRYDRIRRRAAQAAAARAAAGMRTGIASGPVSAPARDLLLGVLLRILPDTLTAKHFAMLTIPGGRSPYASSAPAGVCVEPHVSLRHTVSSSTPKYNRGA